MGDDNADKSPLHLLVDLAVYAPLGLAVTVRERLPDLIAKGRHYLGTQVNSARVAGANGAPSGRAEAGPERDRAEVAEPPAPAAAEHAEQPEQPEQAEADVAAPAPSGAHLAIPGYDTLSASQVVQRLAGLASAELEAVREYEAATRGRRTILSRITQLQTGS